MAPTNGSTQMSINCRAFWAALYTADGIRQTVAARFRTTTTVKKNKNRGTVELTNGHFTRDHEPKRAIN
jgi:hypothetical protein